MRVLVLDSDIAANERIVASLQRLEFSVDAASNGRDGLWFSRNNKYDVIVMDLSLPDIDGANLLRRIRSQKHDPRILILSAESDVAHRVRCLDNGADDVMSKPFDIRELVARVRSLTRRQYGVTQSLLRVNNLEINISTQTVERGGESIELTKREYSLLLFLTMNCGRVLSRTTIWEKVYDFESDAHSNVIDVYIRYLRQKIERPEWDTLIHTRRGFGYVLVDPSQDDPQQQELSDHCKD